MLVRKLFGPVALSCVILSGCEEKPEAEAAAPAEAPVVAEKAPEAPPPAPEPVVVPPQDVLSAVIDAIKAKDEAKLAALTTPETAPLLAAQDTKNHLFTALGMASVGAAKMDGDKALVGITRGETVQDVPFMKSAEGWKLDGPAYLTAYPAPGKGKGKGGKNGKGGKGKKYH